MADVAGVENNSSPPFGPDEGKQKQQKNNGDIVVINRHHLHHPHLRNNNNNDSCCSPSSSSCSSSSSYFSSCTSSPRPVVMSSKGEEGHSRPHGDKGQEVHDEEHTIGSTPPGVVTASSSKSSIMMIDADDDDEETREEENKRDNENSYVNPAIATTTKTTAVTPNNNNTTANPWGPIICEPTPTTISHTENKEGFKGAGEGSPGSIYKKDDGIGSCVVNVLDTAGADDDTTTISSHPVGIETSREVKNASVNNQEEDDGISCVSAATTATTSTTQVCRICLEGEGGPSLRLVSPCNCTGSVGRMHVSCLEKWLGTTGLSTCELCGYQFELVRQPRPVSDLFKNKFFVSNVVYFLVMSLVAGVSIWLCLVDTGLYLEHGHYWVVVEWVCIAFVILLFYSVWCKSAFRGQYQIWLEWKGKGQAVKIKGISENNEEEADLADEDDDETDSQSQQRCATKCV